MKTKKILAAATASVLLLSAALLAGCGGDSGNDGGDGQSAELTKVTVGASVTPHAEILNAVKDDMKAQGFDLQIKEFSDYVLPNQEVNDGSLDANYFQHEPYMNQFNAEQGTDLVALAYIHYEPFGIYPGTRETLDQLEDGDAIAVPNDTSNEARALLLLEDQGLIKLREGAGLTATKNDIVENPKNLDIVELAAEMIAKNLPDVAFGVINGNNALQAGLNVAEDSIASEGVDSLGAETYANIICVKAGNEDNPGVQALINALKTDKVKAFIEDTYKGAVVPVF